MATTYYATGAQPGAVPRTNVGAISTVISDFTWPIAAVTGDAVVMAWIPGAAKIIDWEFNILGTAIATTGTTASLGDLNTAGTLAGANNYFSALTVSAITAKGASSNGAALGGPTVTMGGATSGKVYSATKTANQVTGLALLTNVPPGVVDAVLFYAGTLTTGALGVIRLLMNYTI